MKVALVHDWLIHMRGGEKVLDTLAEVFPDATIYTLFSNRKRLSAPLRRMRIKNTVLHHLPGIRNYYPWLLPVLPFFVQTLRIEDTDLVISSSHCVAKGVKVPPGALHICYCHTPMRYLWEFEEVYFEKFPKCFRVILNLFFKCLKDWDVRTNQSVDYFLCNSETVRNRIQRIYGKKAVVVHPPVDAQFFRPDSLSQEEKDYYLVVSAFTPYKRDDLVMEAFQCLNQKLIMAGDGPLRKQLEKRLKAENIQMIGKVSDEELRRLYVRAKALIFPQEEDFGIIPLEAQACGTPVIAFARGGALETIKDGVFFTEQTPEAIRQAVDEFEKKSFDPQTLRQLTLAFDKPVFKNKIKQAIEKCLPVEGVL